MGRIIKETGYRKNGLKQKEAKEVQLVITVQWEGGKFQKQLIAKLRQRCNPPCLSPKEVNLEVEMPSIALEEVQCSLVHVDDCLSDDHQKHTSKTNHLTWLRLSALERANVAKEGATALFVYNSDLRAEEVRDPKKLRMLPLFP